LVQGTDRRLVAGGFGLSESAPDSVHSKAMFGLRAWRTPS
jgi:hypothetical protein